MLTSPIQAGQPLRQSYAQQRLWFLHQLNPEDPQHNILLHITLRGPLVPERLQAAFGQLVRRQAILRTRYGDSPAGPFQWVAENGAAESLLYVDLTSADPSAQELALKRAAEQERGRAFDLQEGPVIFAYLFRLSSVEHKLLLNIHHIAFDGQSVQVLFAELASNYEAAAVVANGAAEGLKPLPWQYADFAQSEPGLLDAATRTELLDFWRGYLADVPTEIHWPHRPAVTQAPMAKQIRFRFETSLLEQFSARHQQSLLQTLLTLFSVWLHYLCGQQIFLVGTDIHGRTQPEVDGLIGFFVNQLPLKCDLSGNATLADLFIRTRRSARQAYGRHRLPFDLLVAALAPERKRSRAPLFQVKLNYQPYRVKTLAIGDAVLSPIQIEQNLAGFDLVLDLTHDSAGIEASLEYNGAVFPADLMPRALGLWQRLLCEFANLLAEPVAQLTERLASWDHAQQQSQQQTLLQQNRARLAGAKRRSPLNDMIKESL